MYNVALLKFKQFDGGEGVLSAIEGGVDIPFEIRRVYYITGVPANSHRGAHAHLKLHQVLVCLNGSLSVKVSNAGNDKTFVLSKPSEGLYIGPNVWREMYAFSPGCVLMVLASGLYDESDYIRDHNAYLDSVKGFFDGDDTI